MSGIEEFVTLSPSVIETEDIARELVCRAFPDMEVSLVDALGTWRYRVRPCVRGPLHYDPDLERHISEWQNLNLEDLPGWYELRNLGRVTWLESFHHSWALLAWSQWLSNKRPHSAPILLHFDAHSDLGSSMLLATPDPDRFAAIVGDEEMRLSQPETVRSYIERGLIGIGNFPIPLLWAQDGCDFLHVAPKGIEHTDGMWQIGILKSLQDGYGRLTCPGAEPQKTEGRKTCFRFTQTSELGCLLERCAGNRPILLDIDLDYFALLSARAKRRGLGMNSLDVAMTAADEMVIALREAGIASKTAAVTISYSPGFFPSAWYADLVPHLRQSIESLVLKGTKMYNNGTHRMIPPEATLSRVASLIPKAGITRIANITGLDRIGIPVVAVCRPNSKSLSVSQGKGVSLVAAKASGVMEALELYHAENISLPLVWATRRELQARCNVVDTSRLMLTRTSPFQDDYPIHWIEAQCLLHGEDVWVPYEAVHTNACWPEPPGSGCFACTSNGLASGNHDLEAISHGICEVVERDAVTLWRRKSSRTRLNLATVDDPGCRALLKQFQRADVNVLVWNATSDVGIAAFVCTIFESSLEPGLTFFTSNGSGCHPDRRVALSRALTEAAQSRLTLIAGSRDDMERGMYREPQNTEQLAAALQEELTREGNVRFNSIPQRDHASFGEDVAWELERLEATGFDHILCVHLTKPDFGIAVVRIIVPGLEGCDEVADYVPGNRVHALVQA